MNLEIPRFDLAQLESFKDAFLGVVTSREHRRWVVVGAAAVLGLGVWYFAFAQPGATRLAGLKARHDAAQRQLVSLGNVAAIEEEKARVAALETRVRDAVALMAQDVQFVQILKQVASHAAKYQIVVDRLEVKAAEGATPPRVVAGSSEGPSKKPAPQPAPGMADAEKAAKPALDIRTQRIEFELSCTYDAVARFVDDLKTLPALLIVDKLEIEREPTGPRLKVLLTLKVYSIKQLPEDLRA